MTLEEVSLLIEKAKLSGVEYFEYSQDGCKLQVRFKGAIEKAAPSYHGFIKGPENVTLSMPKPAAEFKELTKAEIGKLMGGEEQLTPEQILYMATPYYDELVGKQLEHDEKLRAEGRLRPEGQQNG